MAAPIRVGDVLADKYEVTRILGTGGMGVVVAAHHRELDKLVALKFMHEELSANAQAVDRFLREARAAARLQSEHVGQVVDVGRLPGGVPYIVMEYLEGKDLGELVEQHGPLPVPDVVEYVLQVCEAMAEAHAQGIIHRDLKPQNLFLTTRQDGRRLVKVLDFGISKALARKGPTSTSQTMGSPSYMAPEQIVSARSVDARADIWSLGVILYQLLSNTLPFSGDTVPEVLFKVISVPPPPLSTVRGELPPRLLQAIDRCLEKDRERRFANVAELAHELLPFAPERGRAAIALIERVLGAVQEPRPTTDDDFASIVPALSPAATPPVTGDAPLPRLLDPMSTTLGGAASSLPPTGGRGSRQRWVLVAAASVVVLAIVVMTATRDGSSMPPVPNRSPDSGTQPQGAAPIEATPLDARTMPGDDASLEPEHTEPVVDAGLVDAPPRRRLPRPPAPDAGRPAAPDPQGLEPAREDPILTPARQP